MGLDSLELHLTSALQRYSSLQRRAEGHREPSPLVTKLLAELGTALEELRVAHEQLRGSRARMEQLQAELYRQYEKYGQLVDEMPGAYLVTTPDSTILEANKAAAQLLNVSQRFLLGKTLSVFVCEERVQFLAACAHASAGGPASDVTLKLRPRERAPMSAMGRVTGDAHTLRWVIRARTAGPDDESL
jgi:PAS domain-containing protein